MKLTFLKIDTIKQSKDEYTVITIPAGGVEFEHLGFTFATNERLQIQTDENGTYITDKNEIEINVYSGEFIEPIQKVIWSTYSIVTHPEVKTELEKQLTG